MKKLLCIIAMIPIGLSAQTFSNSSVTTIPNTNTDLLIPIQVSGIATSINSSYGLAAVCVQITHQFSADLQVRLQSPDGKLITLVDTKGGNSHGYPNTCFVENASGGFIHLATPPFNGSYFPQYSLNTFNDNSDPNGTWNLVLRDVFTPADTGTFHSVSLSFTINPPPDPTAANSNCNDANPAGCACPDGVSQDCDLLPDMTASALCISTSYEENVGYVTLSNATPNIGFGPLEIRGAGSCFCGNQPVPCATTSCPDGSAPKQLISQRVYHRDGNTMTYYDRPAGTMSYHPSHGHIHVDNWADFTLRRFSPDPDPRNWPVIGMGNKQSFCLVNLGDCDGDFGYCVDDNGNPLHKSDIANSDFGSITGCSLEQGIYVGNLDIYSSSLNGMGIILPSNTCNGNYYIVSITDPENNMLETSDNNNSVTVPITLSMQTNGMFPTAGFTYNVNGNVANFTSNGAGSDSMTWSWGDGSAKDITTSTGISHTFPGPGTYTVYHYAYNACGPTVSTDQVIILPSSTGVPTLESVVSFKAYPNPSNGQFNVLYSLVNNSKVTIELKDALGRQLNTYVDEEQLAGKYQFPIDIHSLGLETGVYYLKLRSANKNLVIRMVVM